MGTKTNLSLPVLPYPRQLPEVSLPLLIQTACSSFLFPEVGGMESSRHALENPPHSKCSEIQVCCGLSAQQQIAMQNWTQNLPLIGSLSWHLPYIQPDCHREPFREAEKGKCVEVMAQGGEASEGLEKGL